MKTVYLDNINSFYVISDVHLQQPESKLTKKFIDCLNNIHNVDAVILLGDIFDFIAGPIPFFLNLWKDVFDSFKSLKNRGIKIYFTEGNHDFGFEHFKSPRFDECFTACGDFEIVIRHKLYGYILLKHGDEVVCKGSYRPFRHLVKSNWFQKGTIKLIAGSWMQFIFSRYAKLSRKGDQYRTLSKEFMDKKIILFLTKFHPKCDIFIMGHVHKEIDHMLKLQKPVRLLVGHAWFEHPSILLINESEICRKKI